MIAISCSATRYKRLIDDVIADETSLAQAAGATSQLVALTSITLLLVTAHLAQ